MPRNTASLDLNSKKNLTEVYHIGKQALKANVPVGSWETIALVIYNSKIF